MSAPTQGVPPLVIAVSRRARLSKADEAALRGAGYVVVHCEPAELRVLDFAPASGAVADLLGRAALQAVQATQYDSMRVEFAKRVLHAALAAAETREGT